MSKSSTKPIAMLYDPGSVNGRFWALYADESTQVVRGKGPGGAFMRRIHYEDGKFHFDMDAVAMGAVNPKANVGAWKGGYGTDQTYLEGQFNSEQLEVLFIKHLRQVAESQLRVSLEGVAMYMARSHSVSDVGATCQRKAAEAAGFKFGEFGSEQMLVGYGFVKRHGLKGEGKPLVVFEFDEGGWSTDCFAGTLRNGVLDIRGTRSISDVGGLEMTRRLQDYVLAKAAKKFGVKKLDVEKYDLDTRYSFEERIEASKINLSLSPDVTIKVTSPDTGRSQTVKISQDEYVKDVIGELLKMKRQCIDDTLADAKLGPKDIQFLIGSGAPLAFKPMQKWLCDIFGQPLEEGVDFSQAVISGLAAFAYDDQGKQKNKEIEKIGDWSGPTVTVVDRLPSMVAILMHRDDSDDLFAVPLFKKDTAVPSKSSVRARLRRIDQTDLSITVVHAPEAEAPASDCIPIGKGELLGLPREQVMTNRIEYVGDALNGGLLKVTVKDVISGLSTVVEASTLRHAD